MKTRKGPNQNHPKKSACIRVQPIRELEGIKLIKHNLEKQPRNLCLFTLGINTAYRANELLSLSLGHVAFLKAGDPLSVKQQKTGSYRTVIMNRTACEAVQHWIALHPTPHNPAAPLFPSQRKNGRFLTVSAVNHLVKSWCKQAQVADNHDYSPLCPHSGHWGIK